MAGEFYRKSAALYEEFKRRELHYFNVERSVNSSYFTKNDTNSSLQDYLERLNKRERETEKSYKDLLKHLDEMDKSTDQMTLKLEKLNALRNAAISSANTPWPVLDNTFDRPFMPYYGNSFQERPAASYSQLLDNSMVHRNPPFNYSLPKLDCRSESTQTEHIFCGKCHYPFTRNVMSDVSNTVSESINQNKFVSIESVRESPLTMNSNRNIPDEIGSIMKSSVHNTNSRQMNQNETISEECMSNYPSSFKFDQDVHKEIEAPNPTPMFNLGHNNSELLQTSAPNSMTFKDTLFHKNTQAESDSKQNSSCNDPKVPLTIGSLVTETINSKPESMQNLNFKNKKASLTEDVSDSFDTKITSETKQISTQQDKIMDASAIKNSVCDMKNAVATKDMENSGMESKTLNKSEMFEKAASKSDDESINHEFDFLESDRRPSMKNKIIEPEKNSESSQIHLTENSSPSKRHGSGLLEINSVKNPNSMIELNNTKNKKSTESFLMADDTKMESSLSEGLPSPVHHSADVSNHSESDSLSEKETPFTASAAYQALLGNVAATKSKQKVPSLPDSESEDEIENAYAMVAASRKSSNINFDALTQIQKKEERKESASEAVLKTEKKISKPVVAGNTQNKLSKNTRKVLGLDTSSGSEMELETKPTANKIDEDSDEFDFYN